jgi:HEAT repeat protein
MSIGGVPGPGPFRGLLPYDEGSAGSFFGRGDDTAALLEQTGLDGARVTALTGESGSGKTSLVRAGLTPALARKGVQVLYLGGYQSLDQEVLQAASRAGAEAPAAGESAVNYLVRVARASRAGTVLILDHLETVLDPPGPALAELGALLAAAANAAGPRLRFLLVVESAFFHRLDALHAATGFAPLPGTWRELPRLTATQVTEIFEQTALQTGTFFESGLAAIVGADVTRDRACLPLDLQLVARSVMDLRLTSIRRYERAGGAGLLLHSYFERALAEAGGGPARRLLLDLATLRAEQPPEALAERIRAPRQKVDAALAAFAARGLVSKRQGDRTDLYALSHLGLAERIEGFAAADAARARDARRALRRRVVAGSRLSLPEIRAVRMRLGGGLSSEEESVVTRSIRRAAIHLGLGVVLVVGLVTALYFELRSSYTLDFEPGGSSPNSRVVVRSGRRGLSFLNFLPASPPFGSIIADTGFAATSVAQELSARVAEGRASGNLERRAPVPSWLRAVIDGLRPVPRGVALVLLGDPNGVLSLKQAFAEPASRREALEALAVIGTGRAGEDEILGAALAASSSPEVRRRGVEVAAAIDRHIGQGKGSHASILRAALADPAFEVRNAVLRECATLEPGTAASILSVALAEKDPASRRLAEKALLDLAARAPAAAADAVRLALRSTDAFARRAGLGLLEQITARAPREAAAVLTQIVADEKAPEEARIAALQHLRRSGVPATKLQPQLEKAVGPEASPRLRAAALPLYVRLLDPVKAEEMAAAESRGSSSARATGAAVWGALAAKQPDAAAKALKAFINDSSPEVRMEAARSLGYLKRDGAPLISKALLDPNADVQRAAIDAAVTLSAVQPYAAPELLGRSLATARPGMRRPIIEALGRIGQERPQSAIAPLARAYKTGDASTRAACAATFCALARRNPALASPYLRLAARDDDREVRTAAASCVANLAEGDPKGAARIATDLALADEPSVRAAAAASLGSLAARARELTLPPLIKLLQDPDRAVRAAAAEGLGAYGKARAPLGRRADEVERGLAALLGEPNAEDRLLAVRTAARNGLPGLLRQAASDADDTIRLEAVTAAASLTPPALEVLQRAAEDRSSAVRAEAVKRLAGVSGAGARQVLPIFEVMLRSGDPATRRAGVVALGDMADASEAVTRLLTEILRKPGESVRAAAVDALGRIATRDPIHTTALLEQALLDPAHDVRMAAIRGLGAAWSRRRPPAELAAVLEGSETDSARRLVALEALVAQARSGQHQALARQALTRIAEKGPPLARLAAQVGRAFIDGQPAEMHAFLETLLGG